METRGYNLDGAGCAVDFRGVICQVVRKEEKLKGPRGDGSMPGWRGGNIQAGPNAGSFISIGSGSSSFEALMYGMTQAGYFHNMSVHNIIGECGTRYDFTSRQFQATVYGGIP